MQFNYLAVETVETHSNKLTCSQNYCSVTIDAGIYIAQLFFEILEVSFPITILTHNKSLHDAIQYSKYVQNKRLRIDIGAIKETLMKEEIHKIKLINSTQKLADALTKSGANTSLLYVIGIWKGRLLMQE